MALSKVAVTCSRFGLCWGLLHAFAMGFSFSLALRYMGARRRASVSVGTLLAILGVALGTMALVTVLSVTGGFRAQFREKVLGVNAHVLVLKYASEFREYRDVMARVQEAPEVTGVSPFVINPMMVTHDGNTATGVLLKGVDPERMKDVLDLPKHITEGTVEGLRLSGTQPPDRKRAPASFVVPDPSTGRALRARDNGFEGQEPLELPKTRGEVPESGDLEAGGKDVQRPQGMIAAPASVQAGAFVGSIEPEQGYESELPDDDVGVDAIVPDPCRDGAAADVPGIVIGDTLKQTLGVKLGGCIQVTSPTIGYTYSRGQLRPPVAKQFRVQGVFRAGFDQYDSKLMYSDLYEAQAFYGAGDTVTGVEMRIQDIDQSERVTQQIDDILDNGIYHTMDWEELNRGLFTALRIQQIVMSFVLALIIVVAAFTVVATLIMIVFDKKKEIAVLKAMGATDRALMMAFLYQGLIIGVAGTGLGLGLGYFLCTWGIEYGLPLDPKVYFISRLPVLIQPADFVVTGSLAIVICLVACFWPAVHASRLRPADAFRE